MDGLEFVLTYLDDLLIISNSTFEDHLRQLSTVLQRLRRARLKINAEKSSFFSPEIEYLGYLLTKEGIKPAQKKIQAVLDLQAPTTLKQLRSFLGMVQFYRDMWKRRSHILMYCSTMKAPTESGCGSATTTWWWPAGST